MTPLLGVALTCALAPLATAQSPAAGAAAEQHSGAVDGAAVYRQACAVCHDAGGVGRAPALPVLRRMAPEDVLQALEAGIMKTQAASLSVEARRAVAAYAGGESAAAVPATALCARAEPFSLSGPSWNGWSADRTNARFQSAEAAGISAANVPRLALKWAFAFANASVASGQPTIAGGRVFIAGANRRVYALDAVSGCQYWMFQPDASSRAAITIAALSNGRVAALFGDGAANAYAVDATTGELLWKVKVDDHPRSTIRASVVHHDGTVFVPVTAAEEGLAPNSAYECCTARGSLVALDAATGRQRWKSYTIEETPRVTGQTAAGTNRWGPSGASIWGTPTIDPDRGLIYAGTGDNFSHPATSTSDAILAFDLASGKIRWRRQLLAGDVWNNACVSVSRANCPDGAGPDADIASSPILARLPNGKQLILVSQKSAKIYALDPDKQGAVVWENQVGSGGVVGGIQFGSAFDGTRMYAAVSDMKFVSDRIAVGTRLQIDSRGGGGLHAIDPATGKKLWSVAAAPCAPDRPPACSPAQSAAVTALSGVVLSGSIDGHLRAYASSDGAILWDFDTAREFSTVNGARGNGGSMNGSGPTVANGMLYVSSGYVLGMPGNVLLAFSVDGR